MRKPCDELCRRKQRFLWQLKKRYLFEPVQKLKCEEGRGKLVKNKEEELELSFSENRARTPTPGSYAFTSGSLVGLKLPVCVCRRT